MFMLGISGTVQVISTQYWGKKDTESIKTILDVAVRFTIAVTLSISAAAMLFPVQIFSLFTTDPNVIHEGLNYLRFVSLSCFFFGISQLFIGAMRSVESVKVGMHISIMALFLDVLLNCILIFETAMGVKRAAVATLIMRIAEVAAILIYVRFKDAKLKVRLIDLARKNKHLLSDHIRHGLPIFAG